MTPELVRAIPRPRNPGTKQAMIAVATSQIGYREGSNNDNAFGVWYKMRNVAWCAIYISWAAYMSGCKDIIPKFAYTPAGASWFQSKGRWGRKPVVGALAFFYSSSQGRIHHVALVVKVLKDGSFITVEGNTNNTGSAQGNGVYSLHRRGVGGPQGGFGYPKYKKAPKKEPMAISKAELWAEVRKTDVYPDPVGAALKRKGFNPTREGARAFQINVMGFSGKDADGLLGDQSLRKLGFQGK